MKKLLVGVLAIVMVCLVGGMGYADLSDGLVAYYPFDGDVNDKVENHNGTIYGNVSYQNGMIGQSCYFDGSGDYIQISPNFNEELTNSPFTLACWFNISSPPSFSASNSAPIFTNDVHCMPERLLVSADGEGGINVSFGSYTGCFNGVSAIATNLQTNKWYHVAVSIDDSEIKFYLDGEFINSQPHSYTDIATWDGSVKIGGNNRIGRYITGFTDELRIYNRALSNCEIQELYTGQPACSPIYSCSGFQSPLANGAVKVKKNRVIPVKAQLFNDTQLMTDANIMVPPVIQVTYTSQAGVAEDVTDDAYAVGMGTDGNAFEYNTVDEAWQFNLKTKNYTAPGTYTITMKSGDDTEYKVDTCEAQFVIE